MVFKVVVDDAGARRKLQAASDRLPDMNEALLDRIGAAMEAAMKLAVSSGKNKAVDTGFLRANIIHVPIGRGLSMQVLTGVDRAAPYGKFVALGTRRMDPRPFHTQAWEEMVRPQLGSIAAAVVEEFTRDLR